MKSRRKSTSAKNMEIVVFDSAYVPDPVRRESGKKGALVSFFMLLAAVGILTGSVLSAFGINGSFLWLGTGILLYSLFFAWFFMDKRLDGKRFFVVLGLIVVYGGVCFVLQQKIITGYYQAANAVFRTINREYAGNLNTFGAGSGMEQNIFLLSVLFPVTGLLGAGIVRTRHWLVILSVLFPVLALTAVTGGSPKTVWLYLILLVLLVLFSAAGSRLPGWRSSAAVVIMALFVSVPAWYVVRPMLSLPAASAAKTVGKVQNRLMQSLWQLLPKISGGNLNLSVEGVGGGVENGTLGAVDGYYFTGMEALRVTSAQMPQETVYLKGYVGQDYTGSSFETGDEESFVNAASSWKTEGNASLYIQNLPFLRMMYYENYTPADSSEETGDGTEAAETEETTENVPSSEELKTTANTITVENVNANTQYTYVPYQAFLSDNYQIYGGDGYVGGQTVQDDIFSCYWRSSYKETMESCRDREETEGVLNSTEGSYRAYCTQHDLEVPEKGLERLKKECKKKKEKEHWGETEMGSDRPDWDVADEYEEIRQYVVKRLLSECEYELDVDKLPEGKDFVENFLYETKKGYSMHFAASAVMMFRMLGVPARYVVGYAAPKEIFTVNDSGSYSAVLEDDNAHAWVEIYEPFLGWTPVEVTPGMEAEVTEDESAAEREEAAPAEKNEEDPEKDSEKEGFRFRIRIPKWLSGNLDSVMILVQLVLGFGILIAFVRRILRQRKLRLGLGQSAEGQVRALYRSIYRRLVLAGMPEDYTAADGQVAEYLRELWQEFSSEEAARLQDLVLTANYGFRRLEAEDVVWMRLVYRRICKVTRRKIWWTKRVKWVCGNYS